MTYEERFGQTGPGDAGGVPPHEHDAGDVSGSFSQVRLRADLYSTNWDGAKPADLSSGPDSAATEGLYWDSSAGALQAQTLYATSATMRTKIAAGYIDFKYSGDDIAGTLWASGRNLYMASARDTTDGAAGAVELLAALTSAGTIFTVWDLVGGVQALILTGDGNLWLGNAFTPAGRIGFHQDYDSYIATKGADSWGVTVGNVEVLDLAPSYVDAVVGLKVEGQTVSYGADDSGGAGYKVLRVPN